MLTRSVVLSLPLALILLSAGCSDEGADAAGASADDGAVVAAGEDEYGRLRLDPVPEGAKEDAAVGRKGLPTSVDDSPTQVWAVRHAWADRTSSDAKAAGIAWPANSGLDWNEKFAAWVEGMGRIAGHDTYYETFELTTPWGRRLPAPSLECAETAIFLRVTFASWYGLPFFMEARDGAGKPLYFGHFGVRTDAGRYGKTPNYKTQYKDYSSRSAADLERLGWPSDAALRERAIPGRAVDLQPALGADLHAGAYFDEVYLNKRVGYFMTLLLAYFGSVNLADAANAFHLQPEAIRAGDVLIERWQRQGIGHVLVLKHVEPIEGDRLDAQLVSGSMPRRQPKWEDGASSKRTFTLEECGGRGETSDGDAYATLGGGVRRWRSAEAVAGRWTNVVPEADRSVWISDRDLEAVAARPERFESLLGEASPDEKRQVFLSLIDQAREHLRRYPASCSARTRREEAFAALYELNAQHFGVDAAQTDREHRQLEDYVFAELEYNQSKTCCWNSSTAAMYEIIMDLNSTRVYDEETQQCTPPLVFKAREGGYDAFLEHAKALGREAEWVAWSEDEPCSQRNINEDQETELLAQPFCDIHRAVLDLPEPSRCPDTFEGNDRQDRAAALELGSYPELEVCDGVDDWYALQGVVAGDELRVVVDFVHADGDLDLEAYDAAGGSLGSSTSSNDGESLDLKVPEDGGAFVRVFGYNGAGNRYTVTVERR